MKISITARLFLAVLAIAAFAVLAMGVAAHWSYTRGFIGYLNEQALLRMDAAVPRLVGLVHHDGATAKLGAVEFVDGGIGHAGIGQLDESKAARATGLAVGDDLDLRHLT